MPASREVVAVLAAGGGISPEPAIEYSVEHTSSAQSVMHLRVLSLHVHTLARRQGLGGVRLDELGELADIGEHLGQTKETYESAKTCCKKIITESTGLAELQVRTQRQQMRGGDLLTCVPSSSRVSKYRWL